jgi:hypothetical protein
MHTAMGSTMTLAGRGYRIGTMVRRDAVNLTAALWAFAFMARCAFSAGASPVPVSIGAPGSRSQA